MSLSYYRGDDPKNQPSLNDRIDAAMRRAASTFRGDRDEHDISDQLGENSVFQLENDYPSDPPPTPEKSVNQTFRQSLLQNIRMANALKEQAEHYRPFDLEAVLLVADPMSERAIKRFKERRTDLNKGRFQWMSAEEVCKSQDHPHWHVLIRLCQTDNIEQGIEDFRSFIADVLSHRKGQPPTIEYDLEVEPIDQSTFDGLAVYNCKATPRLLGKIRPNPKGRRRFVASRGALDMPARQLHRQRCQRHVIASDPGQLEYVCEADWPDQPDDDRRDGMVDDGPDAICQTDHWADYRQAKLNVQTDRRGVTHLKVQAFSFLASPKSGDPPPSVDFFGVLTAQSVQCRFDPPQDGPQEALGRPRWADLDGMASPY